MASSSSWLGVFSPRISRMLVGWKAIIPSSWSKLCAPRRGRGRRGTAEQIARAHTFLFFFLLRARLAIAGTDRRNCCFGGGGGGGWWRANLWKTLTDTRLSSTLYWRWRRTNTALTVNRKVGDFHQGHVSPGFVPEARARRLNRPSLIVYYAGKKMLHCIHHPSANCIVLWCKDVEPHPYTAGAWHAVTSCQATSSNRI